MPLLPGILSLLRMLVSWSASSGSLYLCVIIVFLSHLDYSYCNVLNYCKLHSLSVWSNYLDVLFNGYFQWSKYCPNLSETVGLHVPDRNFRHFNLFNVDFKSRDFPSLDAFRWEMQSTLLPVYWIDVRSGLIWLASIWYFYYVIHKMSNLCSSKSNSCIVYIRFS